MLRNFGGCPACAVWKLCFGCSCRYAHRRKNNAPPVFALRLAEPYYKRSVIPRRQREAFIFARFKIAVSDFRRCPVAEAVSLKGFFGAFGYIAKIFRSPFLRFLSTAAPEKMSAVSSRILSRTKSFTAWSPRNLNLRLYVTAKRFVLNPRRQRQNGQMTWLP